VKDISLRGVLLAVIIGLSALTLISAISSLATYGPFYAIRYKGLAYYYDGIPFTVSNEYTMLFGFHLVAVSVRYGAQYAFLCACSLVALFFVSPKEEKALFITIAVCGGMGLSPFCSFRIGPGSFS
jgi:hypothetical protein